MSVWPTWEQIQDYAQRGLVRVSHHPTLPLAVACYTRTVQYDRLWDEVTTAARGLVFNTETSEVFGAGFRKFFAYGDPLAPAMDLTVPHTAFDKVDGSLIHVGNYDGQLVTWTKGSFTLPHSTEAMQYLRGWVPNEGTTGLFEGIFGPLNRVVVNYGSFRGLVLLGEVSTDTGVDWRLPERIAEETGWSGEVVTQRHVPVQDLIALCQDEENGIDREGFVMVWPRKGAPAVRIKIKFAQYLRLHKLMTGLTTKLVRDTYVAALEAGYQAGADGQTDDSITQALWDNFLEQIPDEMDSAVQAVVDRINVAARAPIQSARNAVQHLSRDGGPTTRAEVAAEFSDLPPDIRSLAFMIYDGQIDRAILKAIQRVDIPTEMLVQIEDDE